MEDTASKVIVENFGQILATLAGATGASLLMAQIAWKVIDTKVLSKAASGNGHGKASDGFTSDDRRLVVELAKTFELERESAKEYRQLATGALQAHTLAIQRLVDRLDRKGGC